MPTAHQKSITDTHTQKIESKHNTKDDHQIKENERGKEENKLKTINKVVIRMPYQWGFPGGTSGKEAACQCRRHERLGFNPWDGKIP